MLIVPTAQHAGLGEGCGLQTYYTLEQAGTQTYSNAFKMHLYISQNNQ